MILTAGENSCGYGSIVAGVQPHLDHSNKRYIARPSYWQWFLGSSRVDLMHASALPSAYMILDIQAYPSACGESEADGKRGPETRWLAYLAQAGRQLPVGSSNCGRRFTP